MIKFLQVRECADLHLSMDELRDQINIRKDLMQQMVGELYPSIMCDEILELMKMQEKLKNA